jgi:hypothetical protein
MAGVRRELVLDVGFDRLHAGYGGDPGHLGGFRLDDDRVEDVAVAGLDVDRPAELLAQLLCHRGLLGDEPVQMGRGGRRRHVDSARRRLLRGE